MKYSRKCWIVSILAFMFVFNMQSIKAAGFNIVPTSVTYDANTGVLTIYDEQFTIHSRAKPDRMSMGGLAIRGDYTFRDKMAQIFIYNKNEINHHNAFDSSTSGTIYMGYDAITRVRKPEGSINVELTSESNETSMQVSVSTLRPQVAVHDFIGSGTTLSHQGGNLTFSVFGTNLHLANLKVLNTSTSTFHKLSASGASATVKIFIEKNDMESVRTDYLILYINDLQSNYSLNITINGRTNENKIPSEKETSDKKNPSKKDKEKVEQEINKKENSKNGIKLEKEKVTPLKKAVKKKENNITIFSIIFIVLLLCLTCGFILHKYLVKKKK